MVFAILFEGTLSGHRIFQMVVIENLIKIMVKDIKRICDDMPCILICYFLFQSTLLVRINFFMCGVHFLIMDIQKGCFSFHPVAFKSK